MQSREEKRAELDWQTRTGRDDAGSDYSIYYIPFCHKATAYAGLGITGQKL